jgi:perosamine synthetase
MAGIKANMTDVQAAIGRGQLKHFADWQERRVELARSYDLRLSRINGLRTPQRPEHGLHAWHLYVIRVEPDFGTDRDTFIRLLSERGVDCSVHFIPLHHQPYFQKMLGDEVTRSFPVADAVFPTIVSLPFYPGLTDDMLDWICEEIDEIRSAANGSRQPAPHSRWVS